MEVASSGASQAEGDDGDAGNDAPADAKSLQWESYFVHPKPRSFMPLKRGMSTLPKARRKSSL